MSAGVTHLRPSEGRIPPHDLDAEGAVLSAVLLTGDPDLTESLRADQFYSDANRVIFSAAVTLREEQSPVDVTTVASYLKRQGQLDRVGGTPYLALLTDAVPSVANVAAYASTVRDAWQKRELIRQCQIFAAEAYHSPSTAHELVAQAEASLAELATASATSRFAAVGDVAASEIERMAEAKRLGLSMLGVSTGYRTLDRLTAGMHPGDLIVVAGRPGTGKSSLAMNIAANVSRPEDTGVGVFSLEMPKEQLAIRIACAESGVDSGAVRRNVLSHTQWVDLAGAVGRIQRMPLWLDDTPGTTLSDVRARTKKLQRGLVAGRHGPCRKLGLVVIDYLQLMSGVRERNGSREQEISSLTRGLKQMAKELGVPVMLLSQLNRQVEARGDHRPQLSHLRECLAGESLVLDAATGLRVPIAELHQRGKPISVLALNERTMRLERVDGALAVASGQKLVWTVRTETGRVLRASGDHPVLTYEGWKPLKDLRPEEEIATLGCRVQGKTSDLLWETVEVVRKGRSEEPVFDLMVPGHHNFVADDVIVHNSGAIEQDADSVWFIYRPDMYDKEAPSGDCDLIIAKQRNGPCEDVPMRFVPTSTRFFERDTMSQFDEFDVSGTEQ